MAKAGVGASDPDIICVTRKHRVPAGAGPEFRTFRFRECQHELGAALELQLVENVMKVHFNGAFTYVHLARDLFVAQAPSHAFDDLPFPRGEDRKSTRLNSSHGYISYAVFCLKKKK